MTNGGSASKRRVVLQWFRPITLVAIVCMLVVSSATVGVVGEPTVPAGDGSTPQPSGGKTGVDATPPSNESIELVDGAVTLFLPGSIQFKLEHTGSESVTITGFAVEAPGDVAVDHLSSSGKPEFFMKDGVGRNVGSADGDYAADGTIHALDQDVEFEAGTRISVGLRGLRDSNGQTPNLLGRWSGVNSREDADLVVTIEYADDSRSTIYLAVDPTGHDGDDGGDGGDDGDTGDDQAGSLEEGEQADDNMPVVEVWDRTYGSPHQGDILRDVAAHDGQVVFTGSTSVVRSDSPTDQVWLGSLDEATGDAQWITDWGAHQYQLPDADGPSYADDNGYAIEWTGGQYVVTGSTQTPYARKQKITGESTLILEVSPDGETRGEGYGRHGYPGGGPGWDLAPEGSGYVVASGGIVRVGGGGNAVDWYYGDSTDSDNGATYGDVVAAGGGFVATGNSDAGPQLTKVSAGGSEIWTTRVASRGGINSVIETDSGHLMFAGAVETDDEGYEAIVGIASADGTVEWVRTYGGPGHQYGADLAEAPDGGVVVAGGEASEIQTNRPAYVGPPWENGWLLRVNETGVELWQRNFSTGERVGTFMSIEATRTGYVMGGTVADYRWENIQDAEQQVEFNQRRQETFDGWAVKAMYCRDTDNDGNNDDDGDALCDNWEDDGIDITGDGDPELDLPAKGADREHKDVFVEVDHMSCEVPGAEDCSNSHNHDPQFSSLERVTDAFDNAPVSNPDGEQGITLHLVRDEAVPEHNPIYMEEEQRDEADGDATSFYAIKHGQDKCGTDPDDGHFGTVENRESPNCEAILGARRLVYHYMLVAHNATRAGAAGRAEIGGNDIMIVLGYDKGRDVARSRARMTSRTDTIHDTSVGEEYEWIEAVTIMHELGHNLGLRHGGVDNENNKPNYVSIMNYAVAFRRVGNATSFPAYDESDRIRVESDLDYSDERLPTLNEKSLDESRGIGGSATGRAPLVTEERTYVVPLSGPVDWNRNGEIETGVRMDLSNDGDNPEYDELESHDDWANLVYAFRQRHDTGWAGGSLVPIETTPTMEEMLDAGLGSSDADRDGVRNIADNCPLIANSDQADGNDDGKGDACTRDTDPPVGQFTYASGDGAQETTVQFDGTHSFDPEKRGVIAYTWEFGDGTVGYGPTPTHVYDGGGEYDVKLTVEDWDGDTASVTATITVGDRGAVGDQVNESAIGDGPGGDPPDDGPGDDEADRNETSDDGTNEDRRGSVTVERVWEYDAIAATDGQVNNLQHEPAVAEGRTYAVFSVRVAGSEGDVERIDRLVAVNTSTGAVAWKFDERARESDIMRKPFVADGKVYLVADRAQDDGTRRRFLFALDAATGEKLWEQELGQFSPGNSDRLWGYWHSNTLRDETGTIAVERGVVFVTGIAPHRLLALDTTTGDPVWTFEDAEGGWTIDNGTIYTGGETNNGHGVYALDPATGEVDWKFEDTERFSQSPNMSVVLVEDGLVFAGSYGEVYGTGRHDTMGTKRGLYAISAASGEERWFYSADEPDERPLNIVAAYEEPGAVIVYLNPLANAEKNGAFVNLNVETGEIRWRHADPLSLAISERYAGPTNLYVEYEDNEVRAHRVSDLNEGYEESHAWTTNLDELAVIGEIQEADGLLYLTVESKGDVHAYDAHDGTKLWETNSENGIHWVIPGEGTLYYGFDHAGVGGLSIQFEDETNESDGDTGETETEASDDDSGETGDSDSDPVEVPGFTIHLGLVVLAVFVLLALRGRRDR